MPKHEISLVKQLFRFLVLLLFKHKRGKGGKYNQSLWLALKSYGQRLFLETEQEYKDMMEQAVHGSTLEFYQETNHLSLRQILDKLSLKFVARTSIFYKLKG